jgi:hypothetical protein
MAKARFLRALSLVEELSLEKGLHLPALNLKFQGVRIQRIRALNAHTLKTHIHACIHCRSGC